MTLALIFRSSNTSLTVSASDSAVTTESPTRIVNFPRTGQRKLYPNSELFPSLVLFPNLTAPDSSYSSDALTQSSSSHSATTADEVQSSDVPAAFVSTARVATDSSTNTDVNSRTFSLPRSPTDLSVSSDTAVLIQSLHKETIGDISNSTDGTERFVSMTRSVSDVLSSIDSTLSRSQFARSSEDNSVTTDSSSRTVRFKRFTGENPLEPSSLLFPGVIFPGDQTLEKSESTDHGTRVVTYVPKAFDNALANDTDSRGFLHFIRSSNDISTGTDVTVRANQNFIRSGSDASPASDITQRGAMSFHRITADGLPITDKNTVVWTMFRSANDTAVFLTVTPAVARVSRVMGYLIWKVEEGNILQSRASRLLDEEPINELKIFEGKIIPRDGEPDIFSYQLTGYPVTVNEPRQKTTSLV